MLTGEKLGKQIEKARNLKGVSNAEIARLFNVKPPSVQGWIKTGRISKDKLMELIEFFSDVARPEDWGLNKNVIKMDAAKYRIDRNIIEISRFDVSASMGNGIGIPDGYTDTIEKIAINKNYIGQRTTFSNAENLAIITGFGDSMEDTFKDGDFLLIDRGINEIKTDAVFVIRYQEELFIKRIQRRPGKEMLMISDNKSYPPIEIKKSTLGDLEVLGRVIMAWNVKKM